VRLGCGPVTLDITLPASQALALHAGDEAELFTHLQLSTASDSLRLYGFVSELSRDLFATLITGPGVGPRVALTLLDLGEAGLVAAIRDGDENALTSVKGVGPKLAKKIILELGERVGLEFADVAPAGAAGAAATPGHEDDALQAVVALGYSRLQAEQALARARAGFDGDDTATLIRRMLGLLARH
jgi:Holliday junction DNA helicase RuvA